MELIKGVPMILHNPINVLLNVFISVEIYNAISNLKKYIYLIKYLI